mmetsp:Transcript_41328/g.108578  ORF Transcript_41328/g.108578 Transcript_41328/m.108578 type:complete len:998 (+) Transcript_41328:78-3071(+)
MGNACGRGVAKSVAGPVNEPGSARRGSAWARASEGLVRSANILTDLRAFFNPDPTDEELEVLEAKHSEAMLAVAEAQLAVAVEQEDVACLQDEVDRLRTRCEGLSKRYEMLQSLFRSPWMDALVAQLWSYVEQYAFDYVTQFVLPDVKAAVGSTAKASLVSLKLGTAPRLDHVGVKVDHSGLLHLDINLDYSPQARVVFRVAGVTVEGRLKRIKGEMQVFLDPIVDEAPFIGASQTCFKNLPVLEFDFSGVARVLNLPGVSGKLQGVVRSLLAESYVLPAVYFTQLLDSVSARDVTIPLPCGSLTVTVVEAIDLPAMDMGVSSDPYTCVEFGVHQHRTATIKKSLSPNWASSASGSGDNVFTFVAHSYQQQLNIEVWDSDLLKSDDFMGRVDPESMVLGRLLQSGVEWHVLSDGPRARGRIRLGVAWRSLLPVPQWSDVVLPVQVNSITLPRDGPAWPVKVRVSLLEQPEILKLIVERTAARSAPRGKTREDALCTAAVKPDKLPEPSWEEAIVERLVETAEFKALHPSDQRRMELLATTLCVAERQGCSKDEAVAMVTAFRRSVQECSQRERQQRERLAEGSASVVRHYNMRDLVTVTIFQQIVLSCPPWHRGDDPYLVAEAVDSKGVVWHTEQIRLDDVVSLESLAANVPADPCVQQAPTALPMHQRAYPRIDFKVSALFHDCTIISDVLGPEISPAAVRDALSRGLSGATLSAAPFWLNVGGSELVLKWKRQGRVPPVVRLEVVEPGGAMHGLRRSGRTQKEGEAAACVFARRVHAGNINVCEVQSVGLPAPAALVGKCVALHYGDVPDEGCVVGSALGATIPSSPFVECRRTADGDVGVLEDGPCGDSSPISASGDPVLKEESRSMQQTWEILMPMRLRQTRDDHSRTIRQLRKGDIVVSADIVQRDMRVIAVRDSLSQGHVVVDGWISIHTVDLEPLVKAYSEEATEAYPPAEEPAGRDRWALQHWAGVAQTAFTSIRFQGLSPGVSVASLQ